MFSPKKALTSLFADTLTFEGVGEVYFQLEDACAKYGMNFEDGSTDTIVASGELFTLSVRGEIDYTGVLGNTEGLIFKAMLTTYCPHHITTTRFQPSVAEALEEMAGIQRLQATLVDAPAHLRKKVKPVKKSKVQREAK